MKAYFTNSKRIGFIVLTILVTTLFTLTIVHAQSGGTTRGAAALLPDAPSAPTPIPGGPGYVSLNGLDFMPFTPTDNTFSYAGVSIKNTGPSPDWFMAPVKLPNGATIVKLVVYYTDADAVLNLEADLVYIPLGYAYGYQLGGIISTGSAAGALVGETTSFTHPVVDLSANSYLIQVYLPNSANISLVGVRVDYGYQIALPAMAK